MFQAIHMKKISATLSVKGKLRVIVRVLAPSRHRGERLRPHQRQDQLLAEGDVQSGQRKDNEADCRHPMHEPLEGGKAHHHPSCSAVLDPDRAPHEIEHDHEGDHAQNGQAADQAQRHLVEVAPIAAAGLFERAGLLIGEAASTGNTLELVEELLLFHGVGGRIDVLGARWRSADANAGKKKRSRHQAQVPEQEGHRSLPKFFAPTIPAIIWIGTSKRDGFAICRLPSPGAGAVAALDNALLVDVRNDLTVAS